MTYYYGFIPSADLNNHIETARTKAASTTTEPLYPYRDAVVLGVNDELLHSSMGALVEMLPPSHKRDTLLKQVQMIQGAVQKLVKIILDKAPNDTVRKTVQFLSLSTHKDANGVQRVGVELSPELYNQLKTGNDKAIAGEDSPELRKSMEKTYKQFADAIIKHYMEDFNKSMDLNMLKRGGAAAIRPIVATAVHFSIDKVIHDLTPEELKIFAEHYNHLIHQV